MPSRSNFRPLTLTLNADRRLKRDGGYYVDRGAALLLAKRGWTTKRVRSSTIAVPPSGSRERAPAIKFEVPSRAYVLAVARAAHEAGVETSGLIGEWPYFYSPAHQQESYEVDLFSDKRGPSKFTPVCARFHVGLLALWNAEVKFDSDLGTYREFDGLYVNQPIKLHFEGGARTVELTRYERDPTARQECIDHYGPRCQVCEFDFGEFYGPDAAGYIHVHHLNPLSATREEHCVDAIDDLRPVCPNCHAMLHSRNPPLTLAVLRERTAEARRQSQLGTQFNDFRLVSQETSESALATEAP